MNKILDKYSQIYGSPFLVGIFMGINAIQDIALYIDGPDCVFGKTDFIYKSHDLFSKLKSPNINTKIFFSGVMPNKMIREYDNKIKRKLDFIVKNKNFTIGAITCMPVTGLLATQYSNIYNDLDKDFIFIPSFTDKFRIDGYSIFLREISKFIKLSSQKKKKNISIIGHLYDRNEGDCLGNIKEIKRILNSIGVHVNSIWLDGGNYNSLKKVEQSELLISLPYGKYASKILGKKLNIDILELDIPFGLKNTINFIKKIGDKLGIQKSNITNIIKQEVDYIKSKIDYLDKNKFLNKKYIYAGDPFLENSIKDIGQFLGMIHLKTFSYTGTKYPKEKDFYKTNIDLIIGNSDLNIHWKENIKFEFGFPSYNTHFIEPTPYMGFKGLLYFIERLYNRL